MELLQLYFRYTLNILHLKPDIIQRTSSRVQVVLQIKFIIITYQSRLGLIHWDLTESFTRILLVNTFVPYSHIPDYISRKEKKI